MNAKEKTNPAVLVRMDARDFERLNELAESLQETTPTSLARGALSIGLEAIARVDKLAAQIPAASRVGLAREAFAIGLDAIERDPALLVRAVHSKPEPEE